MLNDKAKIVSIKYFEKLENLKLPLDYNNFLKSVISLLNIKKNQVKNIKISYLNHSSQKTYIIHNNDSYIAFLNNYYKGYNKMINIELFKEYENIPKNIGKFFIINCAFCKQKKKSDIVYYCKDCDIYFCKECEINKGKIHKHCYYKINNIEQYNEIKDFNNFYNKLENINNNINKYIIKFIYLIKDFFFEGIKMIRNLGTTIKNYFVNDNKNIDDDDNINIPYKMYYIGDKNKKIDISNEKQLKKLVEDTKNYYKLYKFSYMEIEKALIENNGNINNAVSMLINNF